MVLDDGKISANMRVVAIYESWRYFKKPMSNLKKGKE